ncbi:MAG: AAA family ATPase [Actinomycetota bacterium]|nr:AAA family ATPase [Actinomycetota bacterium]
MSESGGRPGTAAQGLTERTFLIADIRGYTRFTRERGVAASGRLAGAFAELARDAVEARGGRVIELRGDEALAVFSSPASAVRAATELVAVCAEEATDDLPLNVGVGLDLGDAVPVEGGFRGAALNMAARLCSRAAAGQVLVTPGLAERASQVEGVHYEPLGVVELKGFDSPVEVVEVAIDQRPEQVPPARTGTTDDRPRLPVELDTDMPFVGREHELSWLRGTWRRSRRGYGRVIFVSGPTGCGKTRLAAELASRASSEGARVSYIGPGGAATALALAAIDEAAAAAAPSILILDDLDALGEDVARRLGDASAEIEKGPLLVIGLVRDPDTAPGFAAIVERADRFGDGHRMLGPLEPAELRDLARLYAGDDVDEAPLESIQRASSGLPGRVHELMSEWAEQEATRRFAAAAEWLAARRSDLRADLDFANNVIGLKLARLYGDSSSRDAEGVVCPYKGLASFGEADARFFFGRERLVGELAARTVAAGLLAVVGASGSGKSSAIGAGLLPSLSAGLLPGSARWRQLVMRPGEHPLAGLDGVDPSSDGDRRLVLVVDQFEEVFTTCQDESERAAFVDRLVAVATSPDEAVVVVGVRGDFYAHFGVYPELATLLAANQVLVGPMSAEELSRAIELPARRTGVRVESALIERLIDEVANEPGGLPLLSTELVELWAGQRAGWLRLEEHERLGGVRGAVARLAESAYAELGDEEKRSAQSLLLRLLTTGEEGTIVRRRVQFSELELERDPVRASVISHLTEARLLTTSEDTVEVAHEALLREWPRLQEWLLEEGQGRELREHLTQSAKRWEGSGRDDAELYRGARLSASLDWSSSRRDELNSLERDFLDESRRNSELEAERQRRANRRLRVLLVGLAVFLVGAVVAGIFAVVQRGHAQHAAKVAVADSLGAQAIADQHLDRAMLLGVEGAKLDPSLRTQGDLLTALLRAPSAIRTFQGDGLRVNGLAISPDGGTLALEDNDSRVFFLNTATGTRVGQTRLLGAPSGLDFAPSGSLMAFYGPTAHVNVEMVDPSTGNVQQRLLIPKRIQGASDKSYGGDAVNFTFAEGGKRLAVPFNRSIIQWNLASGHLARPPIRLTPKIIGNAGSESDGAPPLAVFYASGGHHLVVIGEHRTSVLDASTGKMLRSYPVKGGVAALSSRGSTIVVGGQDGSVRFLDLHTGTITRSVTTLAGGITAVGFTPDGRYAVTSGDLSSLVWNVAEHHVVRTFTGHAGPVNFQVISPDGSTLYTGSNDGTALEWDLGGKRSFGRTVRAAHSLSFFDGFNIALSPNGHTFAVGASDGTVNLWDTRSLTKIESFHAGSWAVGAVSFGADGRSLLVAGDTETEPRRGFMGIWRLGKRPREVHRLHGLPFYTWAEFSPDGKTVAASGATPHAGGQLPLKGNGLVAEWSATTGRLLAPPTHIPKGGEAVNVTFAHRGTSIAVAQLGNRVAVVDPLHRKVLGDWKDSSAELTLGAALSPNGARVATVDFDGFLHVWDASTGKPILPPIKTSEADADSVNWSPDGTRIVTANGDGTVRIYDAKTGQQIGASLQPRTQGAASASLTGPYAIFSADGRTIAVTDATGRVWLYPATSAGWEAYACRLANRNLTRVEWTNFVPGFPYRSICPNGA